MSLVANYPKFLEKSDISLMQPAIASLLHKDLDWPRPAAGIIAEYACSADQVEPQAMSVFFLEHIPKERMESFQKQLPEISSVIDETSCKSEHLFPKSFPIKNSTVRKLVALAGLYFGYKTDDFLNNRGVNMAEKIVQPALEYYDFLGCIPGLTIRERCDPSKDATCHTFVFKRFDWHQKVNASVKLLAHPRRVLDFLQSKGFQKSREPSPGQIVVYHTATTTNHFAKVWKVKPDGKVIAISKFGHFHVYTHSIGLVPCHYGNSVTFLNPPAK